MNLCQKLIEVRKTVPYLQKENSGMQYKYVSSSQVLANVKAKMDELGVLLIPSVVNHKVSESVIEFTNDQGQVNKRTTTYFTELDLIMRWVNAEKPDEVIECPWYGQGVDIAGEKGVGKALTYAEKYFMLKFFNIPTDKDDPDSFQQKHDDDSNSKNLSNSFDKKQGQTKRSEPKPLSEVQKPLSDNTKSLSDKQIKQFYGIVKDSGATQDVTKIIIEDILHEKLCLSPADGKIMWEHVSRQDYDTLCNLFEKGGWERHFQNMLDTEDVAKNLDETA